MIRPIAAAVLLSACAAQPAPAPGGGTGGEVAAERELAEVRSVTLRVLRSSPERLSVTVEGDAPTPGYRNLRLRPYQYIQAPPDGIYDFSLVGTAPDGVAAQVITPVRVIETWPLDPSLKGVRVHARGSSILAMVAAS